MDPVALRKQFGRDLRIGRAIAEKALAQCLGQPSLIALAFMIEHKRKAYYSALEQANRNNGITDRLLYFATTVLEAEARTGLPADSALRSKLIYLIFLDDFREFATFAENLS